MNEGKTIQNDIIEQNDKVNAGIDQYNQEKQSTLESILDKKDLATTLEATEHAQRLPLDVETTPVVLMLKVTDKDTKEVTYVACNLNEYLYLRGPNPDTSIDIPEDPVLVGSVIRMIGRDCEEASVSQTLQVIMDRAHGALFNPETPPIIQINLINRTLRAFLGAMPFDTILSRVTLLDNINDIQDWTINFRNNILPCLIKYEEYLTQPLERQMDSNSDTQVDSQNSSDSSTQESENVKEEQTIPQDQLS